MNNSIISRKTQAKLLGSALLAGLVVAAGCDGTSESNYAQTSTYGAPTNQSTAPAVFDNGKQIPLDAPVQAYVTNDNAGIPHAIGVSIGLYALDNPPALQSIYPNAMPYTIPMPVTTSQIPFRSITLFCTAGHGPDQFPPGSGVPGPYIVPHLHISFSLYTAAERLAIGSKLWDLPASIFNDPTKFVTYFDPNYNAAVNPVYVPAVHTKAGAVPYVDYSDITPQELPTLGTVYFNPFVPEFTVQPGGQFGAFTTEVDYAYYAGSLSSYNITSNLNQLVLPDNGALVRSGIPINLTRPLDLSKYVATSGYYPTQYSIIWYPGSQTFHLELGGMIYRQATDPNGNPIPQGGRKA